MSGINFHLLPGIGVGVGWRTKGEPEVRAGILSELFKIRSVLNEYLMRIDLAYGNYCYSGEDGNEDGINLEVEAIPHLNNNKNKGYYIEILELYEILFEAYETLEEQIYHSKYYLSFLATGDKESKQFTGAIELFEFVKMSKYIMSTDEEGDFMYKHLYEMAWEEERVLDRETFVLFYDVLVDLKKLVEEELSNPQ